MFIPSSCHVSNKHLPSGQSFQIQLCVFVSRTLYYFSMLFSYGGQSICIQSEHTALIFMLAL